MRFKKVAAIGALAGAAVLAAPAAALADSSQTYSAGGQVSFVSYGDKFMAKDTDCDNHGVYAKYVISGRQATHLTHTTTSGCHGQAQNVRSENLPEGHTVAYQVCVTSEGCSGTWQYDYA